MSAGVLCGGAGRRQVRLVEAWRGGTLHSGFGLRDVGGAGGWVSVRRVERLLAPGRRLMRRAVGVGLGGARLVDRGGL
jgi:hypothetical protein